MTDIIEIAQEYGQDMYTLALKHAIEMAKLHRVHSDRPIDELIEHLEKKLESEGK